MTAQDIMKLADDYIAQLLSDVGSQYGLRRVTATTDGKARAALQSAIEALEAENLGLRLECQGLKAEVAEYKSYWKEAARKNAEMLAREANRLGGGL